jgi:hypothetical protein
MPKLTYESLIESKEYKLWKNLAEVQKKFNLNEATFYDYKDLGGVYWEPLLDRLYKLGVMMKLNKKLREIKMDWIRPILYFGSRSDGIIEIDGRHDVVDKGAIADATQVRFLFHRIINAIKSVEDMNKDNFKDTYKVFRAAVKNFFVGLAKYVKDSFRLMNNHIKLVLKPLLELRKSGYRLFALEREEEFYRDLTVFKDKKDFGQFLTSSVDFFKWEKFKQTRETDEEQLNEFMDKETEPSYFLYSFTDKVREEMKKVNPNPYATANNFRPADKNTENKGTSKKSKNKEKDLLKALEMEKKKKMLIFPNIEILSQKEPTKLKHEAYQLKFEQGLSSMITYLNDKQGKDFPYFIDTHKIFVNIRNIPNGRTQKATNFYLEQIVNQIELLKQKCYEMKLNGLTRVLMPITLNVDIIKVIKEVFDLHNIIDNVMGNYLLYDQYIFIYNSIFFLTQSSVSEQVEKLKNRDYMEDNIPKYVIFQSMCKSVEVLEKLRKYYKEEVGRPFTFEDSYQVSKHQLEHEENDVIFAYELNDSFKRFLTPDLEERKAQHDKEVKDFGRFWLMEGFFSKKDRNLWIEAIDLLSTINELVREDIRDSFIYPREEGVTGDENSLNSSQNSIDLNSSQISSKGIKTKKSTSKRNSNTKLALVRKNTKKKDTKSRGNKKSFSRKRTLSSIDSKKIPENINVFRPPNIWNFPYHRLYNLKHGNEENVAHDIRKVDPTVCYKDNRIQKFLGLFNQIVENMRNYWRTEKPNAWDYFFNKVLKALGITYISYKMLKEEEEEQKRLEEEKERKRKEELEAELKQKEMMALLEKQTGETMEKKIEENAKKEEAEEKKKEAKLKKDAKKKK